MSFPIANKTLGQHFLSSEKVISQITTSYENEAEAILEIGPGPGVLTKFLAQKNLPLKVIEKDQRFPELLKEFLPMEDITLEDALECDLNELIKSWGWENKKVWLVSNLPYNVSTPLLINFLKVPSIKMMTLMFQREVADKAFPFDTKKSKAMNSLHALCANFFNISLLCKVPPGAFSPPPKVDSAVLNFERIELPNVPLSEFRVYEKFLRHLFQFKRKQAAKILKSYQSEADIPELFEKLSLEPTRRAESFNLEEIQLIYRGVKNGN